MEKFLAKNIKTARIIAHLTQAEACKGISHMRSYQNWEAGLSVPSAVSLGKLADRFGISTDLLLGKSDLMHLKANAYQVLAARTINSGNTDEQNEYHALHGMVGEIGEIHSLYQKVYQGHTMDETHLKSELGDLLWFVAEFCTAKGWKLEDVMETNIKKLMARYPEGFTSENSLHRKEGDI